MFQLFKSADISYPYCEASPWRNDTSKHKFEHSFIEIKICHIYSSKWDMVDEHILKWDGVVRNRAGVG